MLCWVASPAHSPGRSMLRFNNELIPVVASSFASTRSRNARGGLRQLQATHSSPLSTTEPASDGKHPAPGISTRIPDGHVSRLAAEVRHSGQTEVDRLAADRDEMPREIDPDCASVDHLAALLGRVEVELAATRWSSRLPSSRRAAPCGWLRRCTTGPSEERLSCSSLK